MENAVAGPSSLTRQNPNSTNSPSEPAAAAASSPNLRGHPPLAIPVVYLPPTGPPPPKQHLASTQDLLGRLQLHSAYEKYVRPHVLPQRSTISHALIPDGSTSSNPINGVDSGAGPATPGGVGSVDKGKGREIPIPSADVEMHDTGDGDDDGDVPGKGEKKKKNTYKHLIKGIPGKHSLKKDDYLMTTMLVPPKQRTRIRRFDEKTQDDAFTVSLDGLKGWNINTLVLESAQAREDRKKRKEAKKAAKIQGHFHTAPSISQTHSSASLAQPQPLQASSSTSAARPVTGTPKPAPTPRPGSRATSGGHGSGQAGAVNAGGVAGGGGAGGPRPVASIPRPGSAVPRPGSVASKPPTQAKTTSAPGLAAGVQRSASIAVVDGEHRGKKREREEGSGGGANGVHVNGTGTGNPSVPGGGYVNGNGMVAANGIQSKTLPPPPSQQVGTPGMILNAKAGTGNVRPRPIKKQRMDIQGQSRDVTGPVQQQPTPQGV